MRIAVLSDIHGNLAALQAVLEQAKKNRIDHYFILGDLVGYYYDNKSIIDIIRDIPASIIMGNHELLFLQCLENKVALLDYKKKYGSSFEIALNEFDDDHIDWIRKLPEQQVISVDKKLVLLCHGSPWSVDQYIYPDSAPSIFNRLNKSNADIILLGHTHYPLYKELANKKLVVNPGSVGQARDKGGYASWCIYDAFSGKFQFQRTPYDVSNILTKCSIIDPNLSYLRRVLLR